MRPDLLAVIDAFDRVVVAAQGVVDPQVLDPLALTVRQVRQRLGYLGDTVVVALAGGTGSGKSSLVNALAGEVVSESGGMRPTTGAPLAWIPANPEPGLVRLLDDLGVEARVGQDRYPWLAVLDLPDTDSVVADHRHTVDSLLPRVDMVAWVMDPEKYQDRLLHEKYLRPLAPYHRQLLFVLNQADRLAPGHRGEVVDDLRRSLEVDGIPEPAVVVTSADPPAGPAMIDELIELLGSVADAKQMVADKLATDLRTAATRLSQVSDLQGGVGFGERWEAASTEAAGALVARDRTGAETTLEAFVDDLAAAAGGETATSLRREVDAGTIGNSLEVAAEAAGLHRPPESPPGPAWARPVRWSAVAVLILAVVWAVDAFRTGDRLLGAVALAMAAALVWGMAAAWERRRRGRAIEVALAEARRERAVEVVAHLDRQLGRHLRQILRRRAAASAAATELHLAIAELERRL